MDSTFPPLPVPPRGEWWSDEPEMETYQHLNQMLALIATLRWLWRDREDVFIAGNLTVYYSPNQRKSEYFRGPDFFVVKGVPDGKRPRPSWVVWLEGGRYPDVIVELLSDTTEHMDRGEKKDIYEQVFRTPEYFLFDPNTYELEGHRLVAGRYQPIEPDSNGRLESLQLDLRLGVEGSELRLYFPNGERVPRLEEIAEQVEQAKQQAEQAKQQAEQAKQQAEQAKQQADARCEELEAEIASLRAKLDKPA